MRLTIIPEDKLIKIDNQHLISIEQDLSWIPSNVRAVQWYDTWGEIEYNDNSGSERIEELGIYEQAIIDFENEIKRKEDSTIEIESSIDYWKKLRIKRNYRLLNCDWTQLPDSKLTQSQKLEWEIYRQSLRDLPENIQDPKPLVLDENDLDWPISPSETL